MSMDNKQDKKIQLPKRKCLRCGHVWVARKVEIKVCPNCRSPYWDTERTREVKE